MFRKLKNFFFQKSSTSEQMKIDSEFRQIWLHNWTNSEVFNLTIEYLKAQTQARRRNNESR